MNKLDFFRPLVEKAKAEFAIAGFDEFKDLNQALVRVRKSQIAHAYDENELYWSVVVWRAKAIHQHAKRFGLNPIPALLALLYWQQPILVDGVYKSFPLDEETHPIVMQQLVEFGVGEQYLIPIQQILSQADCFGCDDSATPHARLFGISMFGTLEPADDHLLYTAVGLDWVAPDLEANPVEIEFTSMIKHQTNTLLKLYPAAVLQIGKVVVPAAITQAWLALTQRVYDSTPEDALELFYNNHCVFRPVTQL